MKVVDTDYNAFALVYTETDFISTVLYSFTLYGASSLHPLSDVFPGHTWKCGLLLPKTSKFSPRAPLREEVFAQTLQGKSF